MSYEKKYLDWKDQVTAAAKAGNSASHSAALLGIKYDTYKKYAIKYGCFSTNQGSKGTKRDYSSRQIPLKDILEGKHPQYQSNKLRIRLLKEGTLEYKCNKCGNTEWLNMPIPLELEHKDGNSVNHVQDNLELLCPNCHAFTDTYRGKNKGVTRNR